MDPARYDVSVVALSAGQRRPQAAAGRRSMSSSSMSPTTRSRSARSRPTWPRSGPDVIHTHMYPGRDRRDPRGDGARRDRPAPAVRRLDRPFEPHPLRRGPRAILRELTPHMDQLIAVSRAIEHKLVDEDRATGARSASSTTAWTSSATTTRSRAARCPRNTAWRPARRSSGSSPGWSRRRATRPCSRPGRRSCAPCPDAYLLIVGEGAGATRSRRRRASCGSPTGSCSPAAATTSRRSPPRWTSPSCRPIARRRA